MNTSSRLPTSVSQLPAPEFRLPPSRFGLPSSVFRLRSPISRLPTSVFGLMCFLLQLLFINPTQSQSLDDYLQIAGENNPEVKASFNDYLAAVENISQVGALPDPELTIGFFLKPMDRFMGKQQADIQLMQMFPWFGMPGVRKDEASKMALAKYEVFEDVKNQLFFKVKNTWYEMYKLEEEINVTKENLDILNTYERLALIHFQNAGTSTGSSNTGMSDVLRIRMQRKELESNLESLVDSKRALRAEFNQLLNRGTNADVAIADTLAATELPVDRLALLDSITANNPMLNMLKAEEATYQVRQRMATLEGRPVLGAGLNYMPFAPRNEDGMSMGGKDMVMPMISVSIPIYRKKYHAMAKEAELNQLAVQQRRENTVNQLAVQWITGLRDLDDAIRKAALYTEQASLVNQTLDLLMTSYAADGRGFEEVLEIHQLLLDYQLKVVAAIVNQHTAIAMLEMLSATELD